MTDPRFFGYGSLVNVATHDYDAPRPAVLQGWRRIWTRTNLRQAAFLSVEPCAATALQGVIAQVPGANWAALDQREAAYQRHDVSEAILHDGPKAATAVYKVKPEHAEDVGDHPILLSYLDVAVQGYLHMHGRDGVAHFFQTTDGWQAPILNDRDDPIYPRHRLLSPFERKLVDDHLSAVMEQAE